MRELVILVSILLWLSVSAQKDAVPRYGQRTHYEQDSIRVEETFLVKNGQVLSRKRYVGQRPVGLWQEFDETGRPLAERDLNKLVYLPSPSTRKDTLPGEPMKMTEVHEMPMFPGGEQEMFRFLGRTVRYPVEAQEAGISGVVYLIGVVDRTGKWTTSGIARGAHPYLDYEAWRVLELMPLWTPGRINGEAVSVQYNLPIRFTLR